MTSQTADGQDFNAELSSTELGSFISRNRNAIIGLVVLILVAIIGYGVKSHFDKKSEKAAANAFHSYEAKFIPSYVEGKTSAEQLVKEFNLVRETHTAESATFSSALITFDALFEKAEYEKAKVVLDVVEPQNNFQTYFTALRKAAILEQTGNVDGAILELEKLSNNDMKVMIGKIQLDLGRLYFTQGKKDLAKKSFEEVKKTNTQAIFKSVADFYLQKL